MTWWIRKRSSCIGSALGASFTATGEETHVGVDDRAKFVDLVNFGKI